LHSPALTARQSNAPTVFVSSSAPYVLHSEARSSRRSHAEYNATMIAPAQCA
jgi:hypothetical protein